MPHELRYLDQAEYPVWDELVTASLQGSLFCKSWYLNALSEGIRILGCFEGGRLIAGMPMYYERRFALKVCTMPKLTTTWGVVMEPTHEDPVGTALHQMAVMNTFATHLHGERAFFQKFHPSLTNWLPFYWKGFSQTTRFTYTLNNLNDLESVWQGMRHNIRGEIRKATKLGLRVVPCTPQQVFEAEAQTFQRQSRRSPRRYEDLGRVYAAAETAGAGACFAAVDEDERIHAANMIVWDSQSSYFLVGGANPNLRQSGATSLIVWRLIEFSSSRSAAFDFDGSVSQPIEHFFRSFGAKQVPFSWIMKFPAWLRSYLAVSNKA